ncbi:MAG: universal stress protein [Brumimicrobium sp.]|nr:universal stress protein [Brumimicrobium sp.]
MKKILVPTDFSEYAMRASRVAAKIAKLTGARIYFLHVVDMPVNEIGIIPGQTQQDIPEGLFILKRAKQNFKELFAQDFLEGVNIAEAVQFDGVYESIVNEAKKHAIDLIVMGTHGTSGYINDFFVGSNADKIVRLSETPVLVVKDDMADFNIQKIVFASDFDEGVDQSFESLVPILDIFKAKLELVRIVTREDFYYSEPILTVMEDFARRHGLKNYDCHIFIAKDVQTGINEFASRKEADMIATVTHGRRGLARLFNGSVTGELIKQSASPVLSVRIPKRFS